MSTSLRRVIPFVAALVLLAVPAAAQTGILRGKVVDSDGAPVAGAEVVIETASGVSRRYTTKTSTDGAFTQIGLRAGVYNITVTAEGIGKAVEEALIAVRQTTDVNVAFRPVGAAPVATAAATDEELAAALTKLFQEGVTLSEGGDQDAAIAKFQEALGILPTCYNCYYNIGHAYVMKKDEANAEIAFKRALELSPSYGEAMHALATLYNNQKRSAEATEMSARAAAAGATQDPDAIYNQGIILWNAGSLKEAKVKFEETIAADATYANAYFQLGMAQLNEGQIPQAIGSLEAYLKLAPEGEFAAQAKAMVGQLKQ